MDFELKFYASRYDAAKAPRGKGAAAPLDAEPGLALRRLVRRPRLRPRAGVTAAHERQTLALDRAQREEAAAVSGRNDQP